MSESSTVAAPPPTGDVRRGYPPLWMFGCAMIAGAATPFVAVAMPFLLRREGIDVETIGGISALTDLPFALMFAWSPLSDMFLARRHWVLLANVLSALCLFVAILLPRPQYLALFTALLFAANFGISVALTSVGGMMAAVIPAEVRGRSAGWFQAGNLGSFPLLGGISLWIIQRVSLLHAAVVIALISVLPALVIVGVSEPLRSLAPSRAVFREMFAEMRALARRRDVWLGLLVFLAPGSGGSLHLLSGLGVDFHASPGVIEWANGLPGGVVATVAGAFLGGMLSDRISRRASYLASRGLVMVVSGATVLAPLVASTYIAAALLLQLGVGMCWATGDAYNLELSGREPFTAATRVALFTGASSISAVYMTWLAGIGDHRWGVRGVFGVEAGAIATALVALSIVLPRLEAKPR